MREAVEPGQVDWAEWRWAWGWALAVVALSCAPYFYAYFAAPSGQTFGGFLINTQDGNSYLAKMRQGYDGAWLFRLPFTPEDQRGIFTFTFYLALGHIARLFGAPLILIFHLARAASGLFFLLTVYRLTAGLTPDLAARRWAFAVAAFGSGLAVLSLLIGRNNPENFVPVDLFAPEANGFYSIIANPHFPFVFALEAWAIIWILNPPRQQFWIQLAAPVLIGLSIVSLAPYLSPIVWIAVGAGVIAARPIRRDQMVRAAALVGAMGLLLLYDVWIMRADPAVAAWASQNITPSPPPVDVLLSLGIWVPFAAIGLWRVFRQRSLGFGMVRLRSPQVWSLGFSLLTWLLATAILLYIPHPLQRRFIGGLFVPLAVLSGIGLSWIFAQLSKQTWERVVPAILIITFGFLTNIILLAALFSAPKQADPAVYLTNDEASALRWLDMQTDSTDIVLADARLGNFVPGWTGARVVYGHPMETIDAAVKRAEVESYFGGGGASVLDHYSIKFIIGGSLPIGWHTVFQSGEVIIYGR